MTFTPEQIWKSLIIVVVTIIILFCIKKYLIKKVAYKRETRFQQFLHLLGFLFNILQYVVVLIALILLLSVNGVDVTGFLAGLGIIATIVGLSLQDTLKDIFAGINIYNNNFYKVGDVVMYDGQKCEVKYFSARITKFRNLFTNSTITVNNSLINSIEKVKDGRIISVNFDMSDDRKKINAAFENVVEELKKDPDFSSVSYFGIYTIDDYGVRYGMFITTPASNIFAEVKVYDLLYKEFAKIKLAPNTNNSIKIKNDPWDR